jgi:DNA repair exonuclease SbcCD ATPase subunit
MKSVKDHLRDALAASWIVEQGPNGALSRCPACERHEPEHGPGCPWGEVQAAIEGVEATAEATESALRAARERLEAMKDEREEALNKLAETNRAKAITDGKLAEIEGQLDHVRRTATAELRQKCDLIDTLRESAGAHETAREDRHQICEMGRAFAEKGLMGKHDVYAASAVCRMANKILEDLGEKGRENQEFYRARQEAEGKLIEESAELARVNALRADDLKAVRDSEAALRKLTSEHEAAKRLLAAMRPALEAETLARADHIRQISEAQKELRVAREDAAGAGGQVQAAFVERNRAQQARDAFVAYIKGILDARGEWLRREQKDGVAPEIGEAIDRAGEAVERFEDDPAEMTASAVREAEEAMESAESDKREAETRLRGCQGEYSEQRARADAAEGERSTLVRALAIVSREHDRRMSGSVVMAMQEKEGGS